MYKNSGRKTKAAPRLMWLCNSCLNIHIYNRFAKSEQITRWIKNKAKDNSNTFIKLLKKSVLSSSNIQQRALEKWSGPKKDIDIRVTKGPRRLF